MLKCNEISLQMEKERQPHGKNPYPKKRDMHNREEKNHVTPLVKNPSPQRDLTNEDT